MPQPGTSPGHITATVPVFLLVPHPPNGKGFVGCSVSAMPKKAAQRA
jgi:hypothetical protein